MAPAPLKRLKAQRPCRPDTARKNACIQRSAKASYLFRAGTLILGGVWYVGLAFRTAASVCKEREQRTRPAAHHRRPPPLRSARRL
jgi:hypothetical protein